MKALNFRKVFGLTLVILLVLSNLTGLQSFADTFINPYGDLEITKVVENIDDDPTLFEFKIYSVGEHGLLDEHCELVETVHVSELDPQTVQLHHGVYCVVETPNPAYRTPIDHEWTIIMDNCTSYLSFTNYRILGGIEIFKDVPQIEGDPTEFTFDIYEMTDNGRVFVKSVTTTDEHSTAIRVEPGNYAAYEQPVEGYTPDEQTKLFSVVQGEITQVRFENHLDVGGIEIFKDVPQIEGDPTEFTFDIYEMTDNGRVFVKSVTTIDEHSTAIRVKPGNYAAYEQPIEGYTPVEQTKLFSVTEGQITNVYFKNYLDVGGIEIFKNVPQIEEDPTEFTFDIYEMTDNGRVFVKSVTTTDGHSTAIRVEPGNYAVYEQPMEDYVAEDQTQLLTVYQGEITSVYFVNYLETGGIKIIKNINELTADPTVFTFEIYQIRDSGRILIDTVYVRDEEFAEIQVPIGEYYVYEVPEPGYSTEDRTQMVAVEKDTVSTVEFINEIDETPGPTLTIHKEVPEVSEDPTVFDFVIFEMIEEARFYVTTVQTTDENSVIVELPEGTYAVYEELVEDYTPVEQLQFVEIGVSGDALTFTNNKTVPDYITISGYVFEDSDRDNIRESGDDGYEDITLLINDYYTVETSSSGYYTFDLPTVELGMITVEVMDSTGDPQVSEYDDTLDEFVYLSPGEYQGELINFGYYDRPRSSSSSTSSYTLSGYVFEDNNGDNAMNGDDFGYEGVTVELYNSNDELIETTTTDEDGQYKFTGLKGNYTIIIDPLGELPGNFNITEQTSEYDDTLDQIVEISVTKTTSLVNFGYIATPLARTTIISGTVFKDLDADNRVDLNEIGYSNVEVTIWEGATEIMTKATDSDGQYVFDFATDPELSGLDTGNYVITIGDTPVNIYQVSEYDGEPFNKMVILAVDEDTIIIPDVNFGFNSSVVPSGDSSNASLFLVGIVLIFAGAYMRRRQSNEL